MGLVRKMIKRYFKQIWKNGEDFRLFAKKLFKSFILKGIGYIVTIHGMATFLNKGRLSDFAENVNISFINNQANAIIKTILLTIDKLLFINGIWAIVLGVGIIIYGHSIDPSRKVIVMSKYERDRK